MSALGIVIICTVTDSIPARAPTPVAVASDPQVEPTPDPEDAWQVVEEEAEWEWVGSSSLNTGELRSRGWWFW